MTKITPRGAVRIFNKAAREHTRCYENDRNFRGPGEYFNPMYALYKLLGNKALISDQPFHEMDAVRQRWQIGLLRSGAKYLNEIADKLDEYCAQSIGG